MNVHIESIESHVRNVSLLEGTVSLLENHRNSKAVICRSGDICCQRAVEKKNQDKDSPVPTFYQQQWSRVDAQ